jgi:nuclear RNA export factor
MAFARQPQQQPPSGLTQLAVKGWASPPSKFAADPASGVSAIVTFLEKKSQRKIHSYKDIGKTHVLLIDIDEADAPRFHHLNGFTFSGAPLTVETSKQSSYQHPNGAQPPAGPRSDNQRIPNNPPSGPRLTHNRFDGAPSGPRSIQRNFPQGNDLINGFQKGGSQSQDPGKKEIESVLIDIIHKRYMANEKYLTFEALAMDPVMQQSGLSQQSASKVFSAVFTVCEKVFETPAKRRDMVVSVSLSSNALKTVQDVIALSATFPNLKNLDLSNNQISEVGDMRFWRNSFRGLEHLILSGNPIDTKPQAKQQLARWFRNLRLINNAPIQPNVMPLDTGSDINRAPSPAQPLPTQSHPEFPDGSTFGVPQPGKSEEVLVKEQMGLRFSFETRLKMAWVEQCLSANGFDYDKAIRNLQELVEQGNVPADAFLSV